MFNGNLYRAEPHARTHITARLSILALPQAAAQQLTTCIIYLLPTMVAAALAHCTDPAWAHVVHIMEEHFVPTVPASQEEGHLGLILAILRLILAILSLILAQSQCQRLNKLCHLLQKNTHNLVITL